MCFSWRHLVAEAGCYLVLGTHTRAETSLGRKLQTHEASSLPLVLAARCLLPLKFFFHWAVEVFTEHLGQEQVANENMLNCAM